MKNAYILSSIIKEEIVRILFIRPIISERPDYLEEEIIKEFASKDTCIAARRLKYGPSSIENEYDLCYSAPFVVEEAIQGEKDGFDGIISYCFVNPGVDACREAVSIPCLGSGESSVAMALAVGRKIGIVTILPNIIPLIEKQNAEYIRAGKIVSVRSADVPVLSVYDNSDAALERLYVGSKKCIKEDGADVIVLGCTGFAGYAAIIQSRLETEGYFVSVLDPAGTSVRMMEAMIACKARHGRNTYMAPVAKKMILPEKN